MRLTHRHDSDCLRDLDTRTCETRYLPFAEGKFLQMYVQADILPGNDFKVAQLYPFGFCLQICMFSGSSLL